MEPAPTLPPSSPDLPPIATLSPLPSPTRPSHLGTNGWDFEDSELEAEVDELFSSPDKSRRHPRTVSYAPIKRTRSLSPSHTRQPEKRLCTEHSVPLHVARTFPSPVSLTTHASGAPPSSPASTSPISPGSGFSSPLSSDETAQTSLNGDLSEDDADFIEEHMLGVAVCGTSNSELLPCFYPVQAPLGSDAWLVALASELIQTIEDAAAAIATYSDIASRWRTAAELSSAEFPFMDLLSIVKKHLGDSLGPLGHAVHIRVFAKSFSDEPVDLTQLHDLAYSRRWLKPYIRDALRIFCVEGQWRHVLPEDRSFREYIRFMWLKEGKLWDPEKGVVGLQNAAIPVAALPAGCLSSATVTLPLE